MRLKSAYREKPVEAPNIPEEPPQPSETARVEFTNGSDRAEPSVAIVSADEYPQPDEATVALMRQLDHLRASEQAQKDFAAQVAAQRAAQMAAQPPTREQKLAMWKEQGMDPEDARFLAENPQMVDLHDVTRVASEAAEQQGFERGTEAHRQATKEIFDQHLGQQQAQPAVSARPATDPAGFFAPRPAPSPAAAYEQRASIVSAPVSRGTASYETGQRPARTIRLTAEEQEFARIAGISDVEFAKQKQKLALAKANGDYGERR